jgi:DNA topoisomerase IA
VEYEHTLLIVESPEIARRIDRLSIPYLTTFSTDGFLWWPKLTSKSDRLSLKARTEQNGVEKRRELKELSSSPIKIICATDHDPAGEFIAWSVERYLKRSCIHHALNNLSKSGILQLIQESNRARQQPEPNVLHGLMLLSEIDYNLPLELLLVLFEDIKHFSEYYLPPTDPSDFISFAKNHLTKECVTLSKLLAEMHDETGLTFRELYEDTWSLFLHPKALITYPRSVNRGFYQETWNQLPMRSEQGISALCLSNIRPVAQRDSAHESIRVADLSIHPKETRKWLSKTQRAIYSYIWNQTQTVFYPDLEKIESVWEHTKNSHISNEKKTLSTAENYELAASFGLVRNSNIYKTLSYLYPDRPPSESTRYSNQQSLQEYFTDLYKWLKHPTNHTNKKEYLRKISEEILRQTMY